jgi:hypothetical protein
METENFSKEKVDSYFEQAVDYVCTLYSVYNNTGNAKPKATGGSNTTTDESDSDDSTVPEVIPNKEKKEVVIDDHFMALFQQMQDNDRIDQEKADPDPGKKTGDFRQRISRMMEEYRSHCANMHMVTWLDEHGNEAYHLEKEKNQAELEYCINIVKHPEYASKYFDVLTWWKVEGSKKFKELSLAANIFLGKPTHNGFQERVFSRGVYLDGKLKKRLKEENFEMSVLNSFNGKRVSDIRDVLDKKENRESTGWLTNKNSKEDQAKELKRFFARKNVYTVGKTDKKDNSDASEGSNDTSDDESVDNYLSSRDFLEDEYKSDEVQVAVQEVSGQITEVYMV